MYHQLLYHQQHNYKLMYICTCKKVCTLTICTSTGREQHSMYSACAASLKLAPQHSQSHDSLLSVLSLSLVPPPAVNHAPIPVSPHVTLPERPRHRMGLDAVSDDCPHYLFSRKMIDRNCMGHQINYGFITRINNQGLHDHKFIARINSCTFNSLYS